jgi:CRISPR/Cas system CSM-associated protein Csm2 small subunit
MKLLRAIFRRFGYAIIPLNATDCPHVRMAVWRVQYAYAAERNGTQVDEWRIAQLAMEKIQDPLQAENDKRAFAALVDAVEKDCQL